MALALSANRETMDERVAPYHEADELYRRRDFAAAFSAYRELAKSGDIRCLVFTGWMLYEGQGVAADPKEAKGWFRLAAELGSPEGAFYCGKIALAQRDYREALDWFGRAASKEYGPALYWLGQMYQKGIGVGPEFDRGLAYLKRSAATGNFPARRAISVLMMRGRLGPHMVLVGLVGFPVSLLAALWIGITSGQSDKLMA